MADTSTQADQIVAAQKGTTGTGFDPPFVAQPWDRAMSVMEAEPIRGQAPDTGLEGCPDWRATTLHGSSVGRIPVMPGASATAGQWPISGTAIHDRGDKGNAKDMGPGLERGTPPGWDRMDY
jgi:hypothetical protein